MSPLSWIADTSKFVVMASDGYGGLKGLLLASAIMRRGEGFRVSIRWLGWFVGILWFGGRWWFLGGGEPNRSRWGG